MADGRTDDMEKRSGWVGGKLQPTSELLTAWSPADKERLMGRGTYSDWRAGRACVGRDVIILGILRNVKSARYLLP